MHTDWIADARKLRPWRYERTEDMSFGAILSLFAAIVGVGALTIAVTSPNTSGIISAWGTAFSQSLRAAMGKS